MNGSVPHEKVWINCSTIAKTSRTLQLRLIAELPVVRAMLSDPETHADRPTIDELTDHYCTQLKADECAIFDSSGIELGYATKQRPDHGLDNHQLIRESRHSVVESNGALYLVVAEPAMFLNEILGTFRAAYVLDDKVATELADLTQTEVSFFANDQIVASSLSAAERRKSQQERSIIQTSQQTPPLFETGTLKAVFLSATPTLRASRFF